MDRMKLRDSLVKVGLVEYSGSLLVHRDLEKALCDKSRLCSAGSIWVFLPVEEEAMLS